MKGKRAMAAPIFVNWNLISVGTFLALVFALDPMVIQNVTRSQVVKPAPLKDIDAAAIAFSADGKMFAAGTETGRIVVWNCETGKRIGDFSNSGHSARSIVFLKGNDKIAATGIDASFSVYEISTGKESRRFEGQGAFVTTLVYSSAQSVLASGSTNQSIRLWDPETGKQQQAFQAKLQGKSYLTHLQISPDGTTAATSHAGMTEEDADPVVLWNLKTTKELRRLGHEHGYVYQVAFSPGGTELATVGDDKRVRVWDIAKGKQLNEFEGHTDQIRCVAYSPNGLYLASGGYDKTVRIWNLKEPCKSFVVARHQREVIAVAFSRDSSLLVTAGRDKTIRFWNVESGAECGLTDKIPGDSDKKP
jgi:WD40 repeat protein